MWSLFFFNTGVCKFAFSTYFGKLIFRLTYFIRFALSLTMTVQGRGGYSFSKRSIKNLAKLAFANVGNGITVYTRTDDLDFFCFQFLFP